jgi:hypothetical protein
LFSEVNTPSPLSTSQTTAVPTRVTMPSAMESTKATFITDHGSTLATRSRALRTRTCEPTGRAALTPPRAAPEAVWTPAAMALPTRLRVRPKPETCGAGSWPPRPGPGPAPWPGEGEGPTWSVGRPDTPYPRPPPGREPAGLTLSLTG